MHSMIINYTMTLKSFIRNDLDNISHDHNIMSHHTWLANLLEWKWNVFTSNWYDLQANEVFHMSSVNHYYIYGHVSKVHIFYL
jgi:hypothetical protein